MPRHTVGLVLNENLHILLAKNFLYVAVDLYDTFILELRRVHQKVQKHLLEPPLVKGCNLIIPLRSIFDFQLTLSQCMPHDENYFLDCRRDLAFLIAGYEPAVVNYALVKQVVSMAHDQLV